MGIFSGLFGGGTKGKELRALPRTSLATADRIKNILGIRELEVMPAQAARAFQLASNPQAKAADFVSVIESDEVLSARVIRVANSVFFFRGTPANDIEKAVANIGLDELRCLLSVTVLRNLLISKHSVREQIWANSVGTAIAARLLAQYTKNISSGEAFLCGLLHDVGKLVMIRKGGQLYEQVMAILSNSEGGFVEAEEQIFELNHVEVGKWVAEMWAFPPNVIYTVASHHEALPTQGPADLDISSLVHIADLVAHTAHIGHPPHLRSFAKRCEEQLSRALRVFNIDASTQATLLDTVAAKFTDEASLYQPENPR